MIPTKKSVFCRFWPEKDDDADDFFFKKSETSQLGKFINFRLAGLLIPDSVFLVFR